MIYHGNAAVLVRFDGDPQLSAGMLHAAANKKLLLMGTCTLSVVHYNCTFRHVHCSLLLDRRSPNVTLFQSLVVMNVFVDVDDTCR